MDVVLTGGGTAGHVTPNLALLPNLDGLEVAYIGQSQSIEQELATKAGLPYYGIKAGKLRRYFDFKNFTDLFLILVGLLQSIIVLIRLRPKVVFSKGGFVSTPVVWAAWLCRIPVIAHESDYTPGLANRLSFPFTTKICYSFPETLKHLPQDKALLTGVPIRRELSTGSAETGLALCGFSNSGNEKRTILIIGGSQGSSALNNLVRSQLDLLLNRFQLIHICGANGIDESLNQKEGYKQFAYVTDELPHLLAIADFAISRAGATSVFEFLALKKPTLLVPLPLSASRGDQILNARSFVSQGFALSLDEEQAEQNPKLLANSLNELEEKLPEIAHALANSEMQDSSASITNLIKDIIK